MRQPSASATAPPSVRRERWLVLCVAFAGFIATLDDYIVNVSLPTIAEEFDASTSQAAQVTLVYLLALVSTVLFFGRLGDRVGFRRVFVAGYAVFILGSALCAMSPTIEFLVASRVIQGLGAAMLSVTGPAILARHVSDERKGWAFGILTTVTALGITLGAPLGGIITGFLNWHMIFVVNIPIGIVAMVAALRVLPADGPARSGGRGLGFDIPGVLLSLTGLLLVMFALNQGEELGGWWSAPIMAALVSGVGLLVIFVFWELRQAVPLLDLASLRDRQTASALLAALLGYMLLAGCNFLMPFYLVYVLGLEPHEVGAAMLVYSVVYVALSPMMGRLSDRRSARLLSALAMVAAAAACVVLVSFLGVAGLVLPVTYLIWRAAAYAAFISPNNKLVMARADADSQGSLSGLLKVAVNLSLVFGVLLFETAFSLPLPEGAGSLQSAIDSSAATSDNLLLGFRLAYLVGATVCLLSAAFAVWGGHDRHAPRPLRMLTKPSRAAE